MEGRWAKLTLYAHLHKYIDIRKPIHPAIEDSIFLYVECLQHARFLPAVQSIDNHGDLHCLSCDWINIQKDCILTWYKKTDDKAASTEQAEFTDKYEQWKRINKNNSNKD